MFRNGGTHPQRWGTGRTQVIRQEDWCVNNTYNRWSTNRRAEAVGTIGKVLGVLFFILLLMLIVK